MGRDVSVHIVIRNPPVHVNAGIYFPAHLHYVVEGIDDDNWYMEIEVELFPDPVSFASDSLFFRYPSRMALTPQNMSKYLRDS
jgi:hypothetical protein